MKFTPGQVQEILQLSPAAFRHWKRALPPVGGRNGYTPCFSPTDLLAMAVIRALTEEIGIRVGQLGELSTDLFERCREPWAALERSAIVIEPPASRVTVSPEAHRVATTGACVVVPLRPLIAALREHLLREAPEPDQESLRFPPTAVGGARRSGHR
jgi:hypothetical protein